RFTAVEQSSAALLTGDSVLEGSSTLSLQVDCVQHLTRLFEQYLLSRTHQHGFLALPSHPADTASLLQVQFLFDVLQKTISLKLISPPGSRLQSVVKIFPFKSLKNLELKRIPPHCLEGLRGVYSQLEVFTCSKSLHSLEELLSLCGGDLSSALPWLELHTLNFSYNSISCLDESLSLLNVLKSLDLSHNKIQDCAEFLKPLSELEHLNLAYNNLQRVPVLGLNARAKLITLVLRNNELETINGVEQLSSLQYLDLAYNLLMEHSQLAPLSLLHNLNTLTLEGNPLYFKTTHRTTTVCHLSPRAAFQGVSLSVCLSVCLSVLPKPGQLMGQTSLMQQVSATPEQTVQEVSSGGGELSDSLSVGDSGGTRVTRKKSRSKVKVRRASISEPSDTDHESRPAPLRDIVLHHQKDIERMDSFREQMGEDWLRYQHHLDGLPAPVTGPKVERVTVQVIANNCCTPSPTALGSSSPSPRLDPLNTESTLETSIGDSQAPDKASADPAPPEEEDDDLGVDLCRPMLVGVLSGDEEPAGRKASEPFFLRVRQGHILEVDMHQGRVRNRVELDSLRQVTASQTTWLEKVRSRPALDLHFSYISRERRERRYIMLDDDPQQALQALAEVLSRVAEENERQVEEGKPQGMRLQCLKCRTEFSQPAAEDLVRVFSEPDGCQGHQDEIGSERERSLGKKRDSVPYPCPGVEGHQMRCLYVAAPFDLLSEDFEAMDHRLKLFLDVEVFEGEEEIYCFLKMSAVKFGDPTEFPSLMVVTDQRIYILEMTCQSDGQPSDWLQKRDSHQLCELSYLEVGLGSQTIHMEFDEGSAAYTLLVRDSARSDQIHPVTSCYLTVELFIEMFCTVDFCPTHASLLILCFHNKLLDNCDSLQCTAHYWYLLFSVVSISYPEGARLFPRICPLPQIYTSSTESILPRILMHTC
uniref:Serine/threonine-protein kinase 11-interacting protein n=1 Tax=Pygocentrus nattereri TaxID=42514 RepID=A0AAR2KJ03_PYGNA